MRKTVTVIVAVVAYASLALLPAAMMMAGSGMDAFADPLLGASKQRIGNYDFEVATEPRNPTAGEPVTIMLRFAGVNGDDLVDVPITISMHKDGTEVYRTNPIIVPYGHHSFEFSFAEQGTYALYVYLNDYAYSGETLTFTFPIYIAGPVDQVSTLLPVAGGTAAVALGAVVVLRKKKRLTMK